MITSVNNGQVKNIIQLNQKTKARREQGLFVAEGRKMFGEAPRDWISKVYVSEALSGDAELMAHLSKNRICYYFIWKFLHLSHQFCITAESF